MTVICSLCSYSFTFPSLPGSRHCDYRGGDCCNSTYLCEVKNGHHSFSERHSCLLQQYFRWAICFECVICKCYQNCMVNAASYVSVYIIWRERLSCFCLLFVRSDGKSYDAFLMSYKSDTDAGLNEDDRNHLESVLEETFGYSLCLYHPECTYLRSTLKEIYLKILMQ